MNHNSIHYSSFLALFSPTIHLSILSSSLPLCHLLHSLSLYTDLLHSLSLYTDLLHSLSLYTDLLHSLSLYTDLLLFLSLYTDLLLFLFSTSPTHSLTLHYNFLLTLSPSILTLSFFLSLMYPYREVLR
jgi:hypothetical protein